MLNIIFDRKYLSPKRVLITKQLKYSKFLNFITFLSLFLRIPLPDNLIFSGPHKRLNNLIKTFKDRSYSFNKIKYKNTYIVTFNEKTEKVLIDLLKNKENTVLVGPLYNPKYQNKLINYTNKYENVKKLVASNNSYNYALSIFNELKPENLYICPSGVISKNALNKEVTTKEDKCLVYFKKRPDDHLDFVLSFLENRGIEYSLFEYGKYKNEDLKIAAKKSKFGVFLSCAESQGFAVQEMMAANLPLYVWNDYKWNSQILNNYFNVNNDALTGISVSLWSEQNGIIVNSKYEFELNYDKFISNLNQYRPSEIVNKELTFEVFEKNIMKFFKLT